jgi:hypothetical protein
MTRADMSEDWTVAVAHYLLNASQHSAQSLDLSYAVLRRVASGTLSPAAVRDTMTRADAEHQQYSADMARISSEFFGALIQIVTGAAASPPAADSRHAADWIAQVGEYTSSAQREALRRYEHALEELASGARTVTDVQTALAPEWMRIGADGLRAAATLYFDLLSRLVATHALYEQEGLRALLTKSGVDDAPSIVMSGPVGGRSTALVTIENTRGEPAAIECTLLDVRRADGGGPSFAAKADVHITRSLLEPGDQAEIEVGVHLESPLFVAGRRYVSALRCNASGGEPVDMPISITPTEPSNAAAAR